MALLTGVSAEEPTGCVIPDRLLIRPAEAAAMLSVSRTRVYELISRGELPSVRLGGSIRVPVGELQRHIARLAGAA